MLSPLRTTTEPSACFASLPVSREMLWFPTFAETEIASAMCNVLSREPCPRRALRRLCGVGSGEPLDPDRRSENRVRCSDEGPAGLPGTTPVVQKPYLRIPRPSMSLRYRVVSL